MAKKINVEAYPGRVYTLSVPLNLETNDNATYSFNLRHIRIVGASLAGNAAGAGNIRIWFLDGGTAIFDESISHTIARHARRMIDLPVMQNFVSNQVEFTPIDIDRGLSLFIHRDMAITFYGTLFIHYIYQP